MIIYWVRENGIWDTMNPFSFSLYPYPIFLNALRGQNPVNSFLITPWEILLRHGTAKLFPVSGLKSESFFQLFLFQWNKFGFKQRDLPCSKDNISNKVKKLTWGFSFFDMVHRLCQNEKNTYLKNRRHFHY